MEVGLIGLVSVTARSRLYRGSKSARPNTRMQSILRAITLTQMGIRKMFRTQLRKHSLTLSFITTFSIAFPFITYAGNPFSSDKADRDLLQIEQENMKQTEARKGPAASKSDESKKCSGEKKCGREMSCGAGMGKTRSGVR